MRDDDKEIDSKCPDDSSPERLQVPNDRQIADELAPRFARFTSSRLFCSISPSRRLSQLGLISISSHLGPVSLVPARSKLLAPRLSPQINPLPITQITQFIARNLHHLSRDIHTDHASGFADGTRDLDECVSGSVAYFQDFFAMKKNE